MASLTIKEISANINNSWKNSQRILNHNNVFLSYKLQPANTAVFPGWYLLLDIPVGKESGEIEVCIGRLNKLYNLHVFTSLPYRFKFGRSTIVTTRN